MKKIDIENIKGLTNNKIGMSNYKKEQSFLKRKKRHYLLAIYTFVFLLFGTITVNAMTNNGIINLISRIIKIDGKQVTATEYEDINATYYDYDENGNMTTDKEKCIEANGIVKICFPINCSGELCIKDDDVIEIITDEYGHYAGYSVNGKEIINMSKEE